MSPTRSCRPRAVVVLLFVLLLPLGYSSSELAFAQAPGAAPQPIIDPLGDPLPNGARFRLGTLRFRPPSGVDDLALSPDEKTVVTIDDELIAWDTASGKARWQVKTAEHGIRLPGASYGTRPLAFTPDSEQFYTPGPSGRIVVWNTLTGERQELPIQPAGEVVAAGGILNGREGGYRAIDVSGDGQTLALGGAGGVIVIRGSDGRGFEIVNAPKEALEINAGDRLRFGGHYSFARFSPDAKTLAVVTSDTPDVIRVVDAENGRELGRINLKAWLVRLAYSSDGQRIVTTERDSAVRMYDVASKESIWSHVVQLDDPHENYTSAVAFSPDHRIVAVCATDEIIHLIDAQSGQEIGVLRGHAWYPWAVAFTADSKTLYSSGWDGAVRRWDVATRKQLALPEGVWGTAVSAASPDGKTLAYQDGWGVVHLVNAENGVEQRKFELQDTKYSRLVFSPDGSQLAGGGGLGADLQVHVWDLANGQVVHRWTWPRGRDPKSSVESLRFSHDGKQLAAAVFRQSSAYLWNLATDKQVAQIEHKQIYGLSFGPNGELVTAGWDSVIRFWDGETGTLREELDLKPVFPNDDELRMYTVCHAPEGGLLATAHLQGTVRVWQADQMALRTQFQVDGRFIGGAIRFSPDGLWLATGSMNGSVALWDAATGENVWSLGRHAGYVYQVDFGRDSRRLLTGGADGVCYQWDLRPSDVVPNGDPQALWNDLAGKGGKAAYRGMWSLIALSNRAVPLIAEKLQPVMLLVDPDRALTDDSVEERLHAEGLQKRLAAGEKEVQRTLTARRALSVLAQIDSPASVELLKSLIAQNPTGDVGRLAAAALKRTASQQ